MQTLIQTSIRDQVYKKGNPCPICNEIKASGGYCKTYKGLNYCINERDRGHMIGRTIINGFAYIGDDKGTANLWSIWKIDEKREAGEIRPMLSAAEIEAARLAEIQARKEGGRSQGYLDAQLHHRRQQPLSELAIADIKKRGLDPKDFFGTTEGNGLGYGAPIFDVNGNYKGYQYKVLGLEEGGYRWGNPGHHHNKEHGEQPLWVGRDDKPHEQLGLFAAGRVVLVEGTVAKPIALAGRLNGATVIGAAGGQFATSPQTLAETLAKRAVPGQAIEYAIDGGALKNKGVLGQIKAANKVINGLGYKFKILWWGQLEKSDGDCDEIEVHCLRKARLLTLTQALKQKPAKDWQSEEVKKFYNQKFKDIFGFEPSAVLTSPGKYLDPNLLSLEDRLQLYYVIAAMGAGKTEVIKAFCEAFALKYGRKPLVVTLTHRRSLSSTSIGRLGESADLIAYCIDSAARALDDLGDRRPDIVVLDECDQLMRHYALQGTIKDNVFKVSCAFKEIMDRVGYNNGTVICAEAEISKPTYNYIRSFCPGAEPVLIESSYQKVGYKAEVVKVGNTGHKTAIKTIIDNLSAGKKLKVVSSSLSFIKKLEAAIAYTASELVENVLIVTSETSKSASVAAFMREPTEWLERNQPTLMVMSPAVESGISIRVDCTWRPEHVYGFFNCGAPSSAAQQLMRLRDTTVDRTIFVTSQSSNYGNYARYIDKTPEEVYRTLALEYRKASLRCGSGETAYHDNVVSLQKLSAKYTIIDAIEMKYYGDKLVERLEKEGHVVTFTEHKDLIEQLGEAEIEDLWEATVATMEKLMREETKQIKARDAMAQMMSDEQAEDYRMYRELTKDQEYALKNKTIRQHYGENNGKVLEEELILAYLRDKSSEAIGLENAYLMQNPGIARVVSRNEFDKYSEKGSSSYGGQTRRMKVDAMATAIGLDAIAKAQALLESRQSFNNESLANDPDSLYHALIVREYEIADLLAKDINYREETNALGQVVPHNTPVEVVRWFMRSYLGLRLNCLGKVRVADGRQIRSYEVANPERWLGAQQFANPRFANKYQTEAAQAMLETPPAHHAIHNVLTNGGRLVDPPQVNVALMLLEEDYPESEEDEGYDPINISYPDEDW